MKYEHVEDLALPHEDRFPVVVVFRTRKTLWAASFLLFSLLMGCQSTQRAVSLDRNSRNSLASVPAKQTSTSPEVQTVDNRSDELHIWSSHESNGAPTRRWRNPFKKRTGSLQAIPLPRTDQSDSGDDSGKAAATKTSMETVIPLESAAPFPSQENIPSGKALNFQGF